MFDAIVVGAGIIGAAIARELSLSGARLLVLDRSAAASGTSAHCEGNILVSDKGPGAELQLAIDGRRRWAKVAEDLTNELDGVVPRIEFEAKGGLVVSTTALGAAKLLEFAESQRASGVDAQVVNRKEAHELEPWLTEDLTAAVWYPEDAQVQPTIAVEALLASARAAGAVVSTGTDVLGAIRHASGAITGLHTSLGDFHAPIVINAAGPWAAEVSSRLGAPLPVHPRRGVVMVTTRMRHRVFHKVYDADYVGAVGSGDAGLQTSSVIESSAAGTVLIGSSREQVGFRDEFSTTIVAELARKALLLFPFLAEASVMRTYSGFRPYMPDHLPVIGEDPRLPGLWHATGHEGAGIGLSIPTAAMLVALIFGRTPTVNPEPFAVTRASLADYLEEAE